MLTPLWTVEDTIAHREITARDNVMQKIRMEAIAAKSQGRTQERTHNEQRKHFERAFQRTGDPRWAWLAKMV